MKSVIHSRTVTQWMSALNGRSWLCKARISVVSNAEVKGNSAVSWWFFKSRYYTKATGRKIPNQNKTQKMGVQGIKNYSPISHSKVPCLRMRMQRSTGVARIPQAGSVCVLSRVVTCSTCEELFFVECKANLKEQDNFSQPQAPPWTPLPPISCLTTAAGQLACSVHHADLCLFFQSVSICIFELSKASLPV